MEHDDSIRHRCLDDTTVTFFIDIAICPFANGKNNKTEHFNVIYWSLAQADGIFIAADYMRIAIFDVVS